MDGRQGKRTTTRVARSGRRRIAPEFPIIVYPEDGKWVAQSLLTATIAVADSGDVALREVCELLFGEIADAREQANGDLEQMLAALMCPPPPDLVQMFFTAAAASTKACEPPTTAQPANVRVLVRESKKAPRQLQTT